MKSLFSLFVLFIISFSVTATEQVPDLFIYNNNILIIRDTPPEILERYLPSEIGHKIRSGQKGYSTGCYRGYIATWTLRNDSLFLVKLEKLSGDILPLSDYFPNQCSTNGIFAQWFNRKISAGTGDVMEYFVPYKKALRFIGKFKNGILQKENLFISPLFKTDFAGKWQNANHKEYNLCVELSVNSDKVNGIFSLNENGEELVSKFTGKNAYLIIKGNMHYRKDKMSYRISVIGTDSLFFNVRDWKGVDNPISIPKEWILTKKE